MIEAVISRERERERKGGKKNIGWKKEVASMESAVDSLGAECNS